MVAMVTVVTVMDMVMVVTVMDMVAPAIVALDTDMAVAARRRNASTSGVTSMPNATRRGRTAMG